MANASPICYADPKKAYSIELCEAFAHATGGRLDLSMQYGGDPALVSGMGRWQKAIMDQCRVFWQADHAYLGRDRYFKITRNALWCSPHGRPDYQRLANLGIELRKPVRRRFILVTTQSDAYYQTWKKTTAQDYLAKLLMKIRQHTTRNVVVRQKPKNLHRAAPIEDQLRDAYCLVTDSSGTALDALIGGVPVIVMDDAYPASRLSNPIDKIDSLEPPKKDDVLELLAVLAANQWSIPEVRSGKAWAELQARERMHQSATGTN